ncbi:MAG: glycosyltransferase [Cryobacterium sp.]|nr:glycosyltransferase [Cryobacterium sp.]
MSSPHSAPHPQPRVAVLLATYNGARWLDEQLDSILGQQGVDLRVIALDDESTDGTFERLAERATTDARLTVLPRRGSSGSAAANFYRLLRAAETEPGELVAFADQDDVWRPGKLARHARLLTEGGFDGVSSNVSSFTSDGRHTLVRKDYPQRPFDFVLESAGPGSTFLMTPRLVELVRSTLDSADVLATTAHSHDWLIYAIARSHGFSWHIDSEPSVDYRQHDGNVVGANLGARSALRRLSLIRRQWHREQAGVIARVGLSVASAELQPGLERLVALIGDRGIRSRLALARRAGELRRRPRDQWVIRVLVALGVW